ncbi:MAG: HIT family protein [Rickettsiaceae bacterium]|nr:HIT family protein [Rickettsiaceae bacterium]
MSFQLDRTLENDCYHIKDMLFTSLLLYDDSRFLWFIMVPRKVMLEEVYDLTQEEQYQLFSEVSALSRLLKEKFTAEKVNMASFGNIVRQFHVHVIGRYTTDPAWPKPVWCAVGERVPYEYEEVEKIKEQIYEFLF